MKSTRATQLFASISLVLLAACHSSSSHHDDSESAAVKTAHQATLSLIATKVIVPTYTDLAAKSAALKAACYTLADAPTQANLDAAKTAWIATRIPWERSEAFLFGPVEDNGYDPKMDDWPLDDQNISDNIAKNATSPVDVDAADTGVKGFHAIEFLLWGANHTKAATALTANELSYLKALVDNHAAITTNLNASWTTGVDATPVAYSKVLSTAGDADNQIFTSSGAGLQQVIEGMADIANEVGSSKIQGPVTDQNPNKVESQYSWNSLADFEDNIRSIQNVYYGSLDGTTVEATSISAMTKAVNPDLDTKITTQIKDVITAIGAIPEPFRDSITNAAAQPAIADAVQKAADLNVMLNVDLKKALLGI